MKNPIISRFLTAIKLGARSGVLSIGISCVNNDEGMVGRSLSIGLGWMIGWESGGEIRRFFID
jgi:hypothetical protein